MNEPVPGFLNAERAVYDALIADTHPMISAAWLAKMRFLGRDKYSRQLDVLEIPYAVANSNLAGNSREVVFVDRAVLLERLGRTPMVFAGLIFRGKGAGINSLKSIDPRTIKHFGSTRLIRRADAVRIEAQRLRRAAPAKAPAPAPPLLAAEVEAVKEALEELRRQTVGAHRILFNELRCQRAGLDRLLAELGLAGIAPETDPPCSPASARPAA